VTFFVARLAVVVSHRMIRVQNETAESYLRASRVFVLMAATARRLYRLRTALVVRMRMVRTAPQRAVGKEGKEGDEAGDAMHTRIQPLAERVPHKHIMRHLPGNGQFGGCISRS
jgi:hypothetical protein